MDNTSSQTNLKIMNQQTHFLRKPLFLQGITFALILVLSLGTMRNAQALTFILDFSTTSTDIFGEQTGAADFSTFGFTGLTDAEAELETFYAVGDHFLNYPSNSFDSSSLLPDGWELDLDFVTGAFGSAPSNADSEYYYMKIGDGLSGAGATNPNIFGQACLACVRDASGIGPNFGLTSGAIVGSIWTDHIDNFSFLAADDAELINLIAGTISHEIGHTISLAHTGAKDANPGESLWGVMGSGATAMPVEQRVLDREFTYAKFGELINAVGIREVADNNTVPEPHLCVMFGLGFLMLARKQKGQLV